VRAARSTGDLRAAGPLIDAYLAAAAGDPRWAGGRAQIAAALSQIAAHRRHQDDAWWVQKLLSLSGHPDDFLRATAIRGLAGLAGHQDVVVHALADHSPQVVDAALGSLTGTAGLAGILTQIAGRLESAWTWPRRHAVRLLLEAGHPQARDAILAALAADGPGLGHDMLRLPARHADPSVILVLVSQLRSGALFMVVAYRPVIDPAVARAFWDAGWLAHNSAGFAFVAWIVILVVAALKHRALPPWTVRIGIPVALINLAGPFAVSAGTGPFSPQGWFALAVGLTFAAWLLTVSLAAWRSARLPATPR
jgi:hypothetical protein